MDCLTKVIRLPRPKCNIWSAFAEFEGMPKEIIIEAVKILEQQRKAKLFKGTAADDLGIKFFA